jgi:dipeptidyl aminopeptidase/acylaminoacyl peptidase
MAACLAAGVLQPPASAILTGPGTIVFRTDRDGDSEIYAIESDGSNLRNLSRHPTTDDLDPVWSANARLIAFVREKNPFSSHIFTMGPEGFHATELTKGPWLDRQPAFSSDGSKIAFARGHGPASSFRIFVMRSDGVFPRPLTTAPPGVVDMEPAWSPDGTQIAFASNRAGGFPQIYVMNADGTNQHRLTQDQWINGNPAWSPDGTRIAFEHCCPDGHSSISVIDVATGASTDVTQGAVEASDPTWASDGTTLAFVGYAQGGGEKDLYVEGADGSGLTSLMTDPPSDLSPSWEPTSGPPTTLPSLVRPKSGLNLPPGPPKRTAARVERKRHRKRIHRTTSRIADGLRLTRIVDRVGPERIFVLRVNLAKALTMDVALAQDQLPGFERTSHMAGRHHAIAATNGDYGLPSGRPLNLFAEDGVLKQTSIGWGNDFSVSADEQNRYLGHPFTKITVDEIESGETWRVDRINELHPSLGEIGAYTPAGDGLIGPPSSACSARLFPSGPMSFTETETGVQRDYVVDDAFCSSQPLQRQEGLVISALPSTAEGVVIRSLTPGETLRLTWSVGWRQTLDAIGGYPMLIKDGEIVQHDCTTDFCYRNPRTAVGVTTTGTVLMVVVDGRRAGWSVGMTMLQLARLMKHLGAVSALSLDGGGSSTMWVRGKVINRPSDPTGERKVSSALLVLPNPDPEEQSSLRTAAHRRTTAPTIPYGGGGGRGAETWRLIRGDPASTGGLLDTLSRGQLGDVSLRGELARIARTLGRV